jgi:hypothetical protein
MLPSSGLKSRRTKHEMLAYYFVGIVLNPEDGSSTFLRNVAKPLSDYKASYHRRQ